MKKNLIVAGLFTVIGVVACVAGAGEASAGICPSDATNPNASTLAECYISAPAGTSSNLMGTVQSAINVAIGLVGVVAVVVMIIGGISFITSQGDAPKVTKARNTILYGLVGLIIAMLSFAIVNFVLQGVFKNGGTTAPAP